MALRCFLGPECNCAISSVNWAVVEGAEGLSVPHESCEKLQKHENTHIIQSQKKKKKKKKETKKKRKKKRIYVATGEHTERDDRKKKKSTD
jgi:hypothetical protein